MSKQWPDKPKRRSPMDSGNNRKPNSCCPMVAAVRSVKCGRFRLARRYAAMSVRLIAARARPRSGDSMRSKIALVLAMIAVAVGALVGALPAQAQPFCGSGYICAYDDTSGTALMFKLYWTSWAQSVCYNLGRYGGRISYIVNDSSHNFVISKRTDCSGTTAPIYAYRYGPMNQDWNNQGWSTYRVD